jgi:conjugal transfer mating pair stabilization protein TraN
VETDCTALEEDPNRGFIASDCVSESGLCYVFEETWDCGTLHGIPVLEGSTSMDCAGPVRCMGEDCLDAAEEQSSDFAEAAAALEAAQMAV